jgi:hypothetical protein
MPHSIIGALRAAGAGKMEVRMAGPSMERPDL